MNDGRLQVTAMDVHDTVRFYKAKMMIYHFIKRIFDLFFGVLGLLFMIPIALIVKISYMINGDFHKIFFTQKRIGKDGKEFHFFKFRSMVPNADEILKKLLKKPKYKKEWEKYQKFSDDPRITKIGKILRKTSLDELPQVINILKGDMSIIGPRPLVPGELDAHNGNHKIYEAVSPGLTSWWACNGRSDIEYDERLELEYYYVKNQGIKMDIKCIFKTIQVVLFGRGAK